MRRLGAALAGGVLLLAGIALLVLPGPGMLLVLAGVLVLAHGFPAARRYVDPVRRRALDATRSAVATRWRITFSALTAAALVVAGVLAGTLRTLPLGGWATGSGLVVSGLVLAGLLVHSYRQARPPVTREGDEPAPQREPGG